MFTAHDVDRPKPGSKCGVCESPAVANIEGWDFCATHAEQTMQDWRSHLPPLPREYVPPKRLKPRPKSRV